MSMPWLDKFDFFFLKEHEIKSDELAMSIEHP